MFGKRSKAEPAPASAAPEESQEDFRENILSSWAVEPLLRPKASAEPAGKSGEEKRGFVFCRKCFEVIPAKEMKCPSCGAANTRS